MGRRLTPTPFDGLPGFWNRVNRLAYRYGGPAQIGAGRDETLDQPVAPTGCPLCGRPMELHEIRRGTGATPTRMICPPAEAEAESDAPPR